MPQVNRTSMILAGPYGPRKSGKMDAIVTLAKERGLKVIVDLSQPLSTPSMTTSQMLVNYRNTDIIVCYNVPSIDHLREFLNLHTLIGKQFILSTDLGAEHLMPLLKEPASNKFEVHFTSTWKERNLPDGSLEDYSHIQRRFAENLLTSAPIPTVPVSKSMSPSSAIFGRASLILSGPAKTGKSTKIRNAVELADEAGLKVGILRAGMQLSSKMLSPTQEGILQLQLQRVDIIVCDDDRITGTVKDLRDFLTSVSMVIQSNKSIQPIQFILATTLTAEQVTMAGGASGGFNVVTTSTVDFVDDSKPYGRGWACRHFLSRAPTSLSVIAHEEKKCEKSTDDVKSSKFTSVLFIEYGDEQLTRGIEGVDRLDELQDYAHLAGLKTHSLRACDIDHNSIFEVSNADIDAICCRGLRKIKDVYRVLDKYNGAVKQFFITANIDLDDSTGFRSELEKRNCVIVFNRSVTEKFSSEVANYEKLVTKLKSEWKDSLIKEAKDAKSTQVDNAAFLNQRSLLLIGENDSFKCGKLDELVKLARKSLRNVRVVTSKELEREETFLPSTSDVPSNINCIPAHVDIIVCMDLESTDHLYEATKLKLPKQQILVGSRTFSHFELMKNAFGKRGFDCYEQKLLTEQERAVFIQMFGSRAESTMTAIGNVDWAINWASRECLPNQPQK